MAETLAFNQRKVRCLQGKNCKMSGVARTVSLPIVAPGLFLDGVIICECGFAPHVIEIPNFRRERVQIQNWVSCPNCGEDVLNPAGHMNGILSTEPWSCKKKPEDPGHKTTHGG